MRESVIEAYLVKRVKEAGGIAYKFKSPQRANVPDRIVLLPGGKVFFVELKAPGQKPTAGQIREIDRLAELGRIVRVFDSKELIDDFLRFHT